MTETFLADEDYMIHRLTVHRDLVTWFIHQLHVNGIDAKRTTGNDPRGDIVLIHSDDIPRAQQIIRTLHEHTRAERGIH